MSYRKIERAIAKSPSVACRHDVQCDVLVKTDYYGEDCGSVSLALRVKSASNARGDVALDAPCPHTASSTTSNTESSRPSATPPASYPILSSPVKIHGVELGLP